MPVLATFLVRDEIIDVLAGFGSEIAPNLQPTDALALMWKAVLKRSNSLAVQIDMRELLRGAVSFALMKPSSITKLTSPRPLGGSWIAPLCARSNAPPKT